MSSPKSRSRIQGFALRVVRFPAEISASAQQSFAARGVDQRHRHAIRLERSVLGRSRARAAHLGDQHAEGTSVPDLVDSSTSQDQQASHVSAAGISHPTALSRGVPMEPSGVLDEVDPLSSPRR
jgi:hypothetical protein